MPNRRLTSSLGAASLILLALGACVPRATAPAPAPMPPPVPSPVPPAPPAPASPLPLTPPPPDWQSAPLSPGDWNYSPSATDPAASFESDRAALTIRCQRDRRIWLGVTGVQGTALVIRTSFAARRLRTDPQARFEVYALLSASDPLLDQMAFSRGRFLVTVEGGPSLIVPAWPEFARVVEDCRGQ